MKHPARFLAACRMAREAGKPVVVLKLGASAEGRAAALAHTGALAGATEAFDAVAGAAGVIRVRTLDDIVEAAEYFTHAPLPRGANLGGITFSGALRGLLFDGAAANGLRFPPLAPATRKRLAKPCSASARSSAIRSMRGLRRSPMWRSMSPACRRCSTIPPSISCWFRKSCRAHPVSIARKRACAPSTRLRRTAASQSCIFSMLSHSLTDSRPCVARAIAAHCPSCRRSTRPCARCARIASYAERAAAPPATVGRSPCANRDPSGRSGQAALDSPLARERSGPQGDERGRIQDAAARFYGIRWPAGRRWRAAQRKRSRSPSASATRWWRRP